jgi:hypothetical protein
MRKQARAGIVWWSGGPRLASPESRFVTPRPRERGRRRSVAYRVSCIVYRGVFDPASSFAIVSGFLNGTKICPATRRVAKLTTPERPGNGGSRNRR